LLSLGICSVSKESCSNILKAGPGSSIAIVVGGAAESLSAHPGTADLTLRKRCVADSKSVKGVSLKCESQAWIYQGCYPTWVYFLSTTSPESGELTTLKG